MTFWKTALVLAVSVMLVGTQTVFAFGHNPQTASAPRECRCCSCKQLNCCVAQPTPAPEPVPATPARAISQSNLQIIAAFVSLLLPAPEKATAPVSFSPSISPVPTAVPLYDRNCSYLI